MTPERPNYLAYLLRLWETKDEQGTTWRVSLEDVSTHIRHGFASLEKAFAFLRKCIDQDSNQEDNFNSKGE